MTQRYAIHPSIGVARVGNSPDEFYLAPETIGGLPLNCDAFGNPIMTKGAPDLVTQFKDNTGRIKRQAARFQLFRYDDANPSAPPTLVGMDDPAISTIEWTVHIANKKASWYQFSELEGDLMFGSENSYTARDIPLRNASVQTHAGRQQLIIDPGPRTLTGARQKAAFSKETIPTEYKHGSFPPSPSQGQAITTLGNLLTDDQGQLVVLGGFGNAGGDEPIDSFAGADTWHDDIADGPVTCRVWLKGGKSVELNAWVTVGSPKFAPELVNVVTLDDIAFDVGVRYLDLVPDMYSPNGWNPNYVANFWRDIEPIMKRPLDYIWVANVPSMVAFAAPPFDPRDASDANSAFRAEYYSFFRRPGHGPDDQHNQLWSGADHTGVPLMPLNSGSNSVSNTLTDKFLTLTDTQYFLLGQWAAGKFTTGAQEPIGNLHALDRASIGNCVGGPMCPGIEVTWSTRNPAIYERPFHIRSRHNEAYYYEHGLSTTHDECAGGGCEPGDLTKRMAIPWQADFFQCTAQLINFTDAGTNKDPNGIPEPPTYYAYWWPPQSPMYVVSGPKTMAEQQAAGVDAGYQVYFPRGINSFSQMIQGWSYLAFIANQSEGPSRSRYPYFAEVERNNQMFKVASVAVGSVSNVINPEDTTFTAVWYLETEEKPKGLAGMQGAGGVVRSPARGHRRQHGRN